MVGSNTVLDSLKNEPHRQWAPAVEIFFKNVTCSVKTTFNYFSKGVTAEAVMKTCRRCVTFGCLQQDKKEILHGVSGEFRSGELTAIMGPSGAGKSTLLNILAGYNDKGWTGEVIVEGGGGRRAYIMQEESLHPLLTILEIMTIAASLKLGSHVTKKQKEHRVNEILHSLGLSGHVNTLTGNLSGGQRKRLGIALELIDNPKIMFFDEPTSGLDSVSTKQCVKLLKDLAKEGRVVVCTIHQPSATVFSGLDQVYVLANGFCAFSGTPANLTTHLSEHGLNCPPYHNPADFLMEVCSGEYGDHVKVMSDSCQNGKSHRWWMPIESDKPLASHFEVGEGPNSERLSNMGAFDVIECSHTYPTSFLCQTLVLVKRICLTLMRDQFLMHSRLIIHAVIALLLGVFFYNIGRDAGMVFNNYNVLFFSILFLSFSALQSMVISFPLEVPIIRKEHFNCWYSVKAYYFASNLADFPIQVACVLIYCGIVYWMSGQPREWMRFGMFTFMAVITSILAQTMGYLVGASMKVMNGVMFGPLSIMPWVIFSGFFLQAKDSPEWSRWLYSVSWLRRGIEGLTTAVYGYSRGPLPCLSEDYCHFVSPKKFLKELDMSDHSFLFNIIFLFSMTLALKIITYSVLMYQLKHKR